MRLPLAHRGCKTTKFQLYINRYAIIVRTHNHKLVDPILLCFIQHPSMRSGCTQIISNSRGHLNPNVPRSPASPWGSFVGTWQAERRPIQLRTRTKLLAHLSQIDQREGGSRKSSRVASARVASRESQREVTSPQRPQSAGVSEQGSREGAREGDGSGSTEAQDQMAGTKPPTPAKETGSKPPTPSSTKPPTPSKEICSKPPTPGEETGTSKPPTPATAIGSKPSTAATGGVATPPPAPQPARAVLAASSRTTSLPRSHTPTSSISSRARSASTIRQTPQYVKSPPLHSLQPRASSAVSGEGANSSLTSTRVSTPHIPCTSAAGHTPINPELATAAT